MIRPHINLEVSNLAASIDFYSRVFGCEPSKLKADYANYRLSEPALHLAIVEKTDRPARAETDGQHFGFELFSMEELDAWKAKVRETGILPTLEEENTTCCYAVADKFWLTDPDGNQWEFWFKTDDDGATLFTSQTEESACCAPTCCP